MVNVLGKLIEALNEASVSEKSNSKKQREEYSGGYTSE